MEAYEALAADGQHLGGAIIVIKADEHRGELAFLYVKVGVQSKGIIFAFDNILPLGWYLSNLEQLSL